MIISGVNFNPTILSRIKISFTYAAQLLHFHFYKSGFASDVFALTALFEMCAKLGMLRSARHLFDEMPLRDIPTWNSMIAGCARSGNMGGCIRSV